MLTKHLNASIDPNSNPNTFIMKKYILLLLFAYSFHANADTYYLGADYMLSDIEISNENAKPKSTILRAGASNNNMAFEAQYLIASNDDNIYNLEFELEKSAALFFVMQSDVVNGFGLDISLGYAMNEMTVASSSVSLPTDYNYDGFAWGIAVHQQLPFIKNTQMRLAYQSLFKGDDVEISGISLGFTYHF